MGTTPIYGFPYPDPSDLVANYPAMGQELAEDIEAVLPTLGGLTKVTATPFSAVASVSVNNCFTSTYENYRIIIPVTQASVDINLTMRLRVSAADNSTSNYNTQYLAVSSTSTFPGAASAGTSFDMRNVDGAAAALRYAAVLDVYSPQKTERTLFTANVRRYGSDGAQAIDIIGGSFDATTVFDGFSLIANTGNISGTIRVYGYKD
jgi:hypothetical protein